MTPEEVLVTVRFFLDFSLLLMFGTSLFLTVQCPAALAQELCEALWTPRLVLAIAVSVMAFCAVPVQTALIGDGWGDAVQLSNLRDVMVSTSVGTMFGLQSTGALLLLATCVRSSLLSWRGTVLVSGAMLAILAGQGHAVMQEGMIGLAHQGNDALHVLSAGAWIGGLIPLAMILTGARSAPLPSDAVIALRRFSVFGHVFVAVVLATGAANMIFILGRPEYWPTPYRTLLAFKIALVGVMICLALANRYVFVPALRRKPDLASRVLLRGTCVEIALGTLVILLVAIFGTLDPG